MNPLHRGISQILKSHITAQSLGALFVDVVDVSQKPRVSCKD